MELDVEVPLPPGVPNMPAVLEAIADAKAQAVEPEPVLAEADLEPFEPEPEVAQLAQLDAVGDDPAAEERGWPEETGDDDDPYLAQLRKSRSIMPERFSHVANDIKWAVSPLGRQNARAELRNMMSCYMNATSVVLRAFADAVDERIPD